MKNRFLGIDLTVAVSGLTNKDGGKRNYLRKLRQTPKGFRLRDAVSDGQAGGYLLLVNLLLKSFKKTGLVGHFFEKNDHRASRSLPSRKAWIGEGWCRETELNHRRRALQALALPLSYPGIKTTYKDIWYIF